VECCCYCHCFCGLRQGGEGGDDFGAIVLERGGACLAREVEDCGEVAGVTSELEILVTETIRKLNVLQSWRENLRRTTCSFRFNLRPSCYHGRRARLCIPFRTNSRREILRC